MSKLGKAYLIDGSSGIFPRHPTGLMEMRDNGKSEPRPIASGQKLVLAPEDAERRITITATTLADISFKPGGIVPGILILPPDFPENKENWPFFWVRMNI